MQLIALAISVLTGLHPVGRASQMEARDSLSVDTLREVTVRAGRVLNVDSMQLHGGNDVLKQPLPPPTVGDVIEKLLPGFNDKATHPFAIRQRKRERRHKRAMRALDNYDKVKSFDDLLRESYKRQMLEDSLMSIKP